ncbi:cytochrome-c peroxidase [Bradyrhizobium sp. 26S5]|uniref:cytochrome-c peroxidase n=1 Tax=Bradyrhizobium sp. 26S5 TaxID=3139729 RepID=UPI0039C876F9
MRIKYRAFASAIVLLALAIGPGQARQEMSRAEARRLAERLSALGQALFFDPSLSPSGKLACSSCHDPAHGFGPANAMAVQLGGGDLRQPGVRAVPSLKYLQVVPSFTEHFHDSEDEADESVDNGPTGGLTWDGRVDRGADQARIPLLSDFEMGNRNEADVARRVLAAGHGKAIAAIAGPKKAANPATVYKTALKALEVYQQDYRTFYPYSSKYDAVLAGKAELTPAEARGLDLFNAANKGNCASCHISRRGNDGTPPQFTDYGLIALGVPRNPDIPANKDPAYFDLGLCGPLRTDFLKREDYCGLFRTPTLRNVALRQTFFHNGAVHSLRDAVRFYVERETRPERWYPRNAEGSIDKYDDLPDRPKANVCMDPPFDRKAGDEPALTSAEIDDVVAFLGTLTDGYQPAK